MIRKQNGPKEMPPWGRKQKLSTIEGIGEDHAQRLREVGIATTGALLRAGSSPQGREELVEKTGISGKLMLEWVNHVDLFRIKGIGEEYSDLLEEAGVDTVPELAQRNPANLFAKLRMVNEEKKLVRRLPSQGQVSDWVERAKDLPRIITY